MLIVFQCCSRDTRKTPMTSMMRDHMGKSVPRKVKTSANCSSGSILAGIVWYGQSWPDQVLYHLKSWWGWYWTCWRCMWYRERGKLMKSQAFQSSWDSTPDSNLMAPHFLDFLKLIILNDHYSVQTNKEILPSPILQPGVKWHYSCSGFWFCFLFFFFLFLCCKVRCTHQ